MYKKIMTGCVDLSFPNLHYLAYLVSSDMQARHVPYMSSSVEAHAALPGSVPFFFMDYTKVWKGASTMVLMDAKDKKPWFPLSDDDNLFKEWRRLLARPKLWAQLLVAIPRGAKDTAQMMTAGLMLSGESAGQEPRIAIRWLHCQ